VVSEEAHPTLIKSLGLAWPWPSRVLTVPVDSRGECAPIGSGSQTAFDRLSPPETEYRRV
jgi:hypothetical protein